MDITLFFKGCVKTIKSKNRAFGQTAVENDKSRILYGRQAKYDFTTKSKEIIQQITRLLDFLAEHQQAYLNFSNYLVGLPQMSDVERDKIDAGAQKIISMCSNFINDLGQEITNCEKPNQVLEHQKIVVTLMKDYLKQVCKMYSKQKAIRIQHTVELKNLTRIDSNITKRNCTNLENSVITGAGDRVDSYNAETNTSPFLEDEDLSPEELQVFELENSELYNELNNISDEVKQIESKVVKIAELQELFTEKVLQQDKDMDHIAAMVLGTTENVKDANDQIRQAIQRNAGLRVWVLFFLLVMSFSLLFLDWYND